MEFKATYKLEYTDGRYRIVNQKGFDRDCQALQPATLEITLKKYRPKRTLPQNNFFHVLITIIRAHLLDLGWSQARSFDWVKKKVKIWVNFVEEDVDPLTGEITFEPKETSGATKAEMIDLIADIQRFCAEHLDLVLQDPGEQTDLDFNR